jgi:hypothetical protein
MSRLERWSQGLATPPAMLRFWLCLVAMTLLSIVYTLVVTYVFKLQYPYGLPLFFADDRWFDFTIYHDRFMHFREASFWDAYEYPFTYPAPLAVLYALLYKIPHALRYYLLAYIAAAISAGMMLRRALVERGVANFAAIVFTATLLVTNYPLRTLFESANTEGLVAIIAAYGVYAILRDRCWRGAALIAVAGTLKIFPFVLLALLLSRRRYREFAWGIVVAAAVSLTSLAIVGPSIAEAQRHIDAGIAYVKYTFIFSVNPAAVTFNHSLFTLVKFAIVGLHRQLHPMAIHDHADFLVRAASERALLNATFNVYVTAVALFGIMVYFVWIRPLPLLNQLIALTICALILPPLSADYTLLHLLFPFALLCLYAAEKWREGTAVPGLTASVICFAPIFAFQTYITWRYRFSCEFRTLAMVALLVVVMRYRFPWQSIDNPAAV